jgi:hypothetical protein
MRDSEPASGTAALAEVDSSVSDNDVDLGRVVVLPYLGDLRVRRDSDSHPNASAVAVITYSPRRLRMSHSAVT